MRSRSRTFVARGLEPLCAPPTTTVRRGSPILPPHGNRSDGCTRVPADLEKPSSIALLTPDSHRRHVCRCYRRCGPAPLLRTEERPRRSL